VTVINESPTHAETVAITAPGTHGGGFEQLLAPKLTARTGATLGGLSYGSSTTTGLPGGRSTAETVPAAAHATYRVTLPAASAALLTLTR
jgi:hypothetical protein